MQITLRYLISAGVFLFGAVSISCPPSNTVPPRNPPCCGDRTRTPQLTVNIPPVEIASVANQVPDGLRGCKPSGDEILSIAIEGRLAGCALSQGEAFITFQQLSVTFTTGRCEGMRRGSQRHEPVILLNVIYKYEIQAGSSPPCVRSSEVTWASYHTNDPGYNTLFLTQGPQTMLPILDTYVLAWVASTARPSTPTVCPPRPIFSGTRSRCS
jgi:hypothetical protein